MNQCLTEADGRYAVVRLSGEVDLSWSAQVRQAVLAALADSEHVAVHLGAVQYIDSSGIAANTIFSRSTFFSSLRTCSASDRRKNTNHGCQLGDSVRIVPCVWRSAK